MFNTLEHILSLKYSLDTGEKYLDLKREFENIFNIQFSYTNDPHW